MIRRKPRTPLLLAAVLSLCTALTACSTSEPGTGEEGTEEETDVHISFFWVEREIRVRTLDRMLVENDQEEVLENSTGSQEILFDTRILQETEDGYVVELDKDEWRDEEVLHLGELDGALANAVDFNEVTWCGETVTGEEFVDAYMEEFWETLDNHEEYTASIADYVDCGDGRP